MQIKVTGIVLKDMNIGESDRIVTILTEEMGIMRAFAKGSRKLGGRLFAGTQVLSSAKFLITEGKDKYIITEAEGIPNRSFFELRNDIVRLSLAQYISELTMLLAPHNEEAGEYLRLVLNSFTALKDLSRNERLIKASAELRLLAISGFCPELSGCSACGDVEGQFAFYPNEGSIICSNCKNPANGILVTDGIISAMNYIIGAPLEKIFSFKLNDQSLKTLNSLTEKYMHECTERTFKTLEFYNSLI